MKSKKKSKTFELKPLVECIEEKIGGDWGMENSINVPEGYERVQVIRGAELKNWNHDKGKTASIRLVKKSSLEKRSLKEGDLIIEISGGSTTFTAGRTALIDEETIKQSVYPLICTNFFKKIIVKPTIDPLYLKYYLDYLHIFGKIKPFIQQTTGIQNLNFTDYFKLTLVPLPLNGVQKTITEKLQKFYSNLLIVSDSLKKVKLKQAQYKKSILTFAFNGNLTEQWRKINEGKYDSAISVLEKIERKKGKHEITHSPANGELNGSKIPRGWEWTTIGNISDSMKNGIYKPRNFYSDDGIVCLRMYNIQNGQITLQNLKRMELTNKEIEEYELIPGNILVNRVNSKELVGKAARIPEGIEKCVFESKNIRLRLVPDYVNSKFVNYWFLFRSEEYFSKNSQQTVGMASVNQIQLSSMPMIFPSLEEQAEIVIKLEYHFNEMENISKIIEKYFNQLQILQMAVLQLEFSKKFV